MAVLLTMTGGCAEEVRLLANPGFEAGLEGWSLWPEDSGSTMNLDTAVSAEGAASLRVDAISPADRAFVNTVTADFEPNVVYRISVAIRKDPGVPDSAVGFLINYRGDAGILRRADPMGIERSPEGGWTRWSGLFYCDTPEVTTWQFLLRVEYAVGSVWFDDIRFERLGPPDEITPDVWTYLPIGVEIGSGPAARFSRRMEARDEGYLAAARYNELLMASALAEARLREIERCYAYAGRPTPAVLRARFETAEQRLDEAYGAFAAAFKSGDWAGFEPAAAALEGAIAQVTEALDVARAAIAPTQPPALPAHLGEQPRTVPPFDRNHRMNRLLVGVWSPTQWREFEAPFNFEFHSAAPGRPADWPEGGEPDFSNITQTCDQLEGYGYRGTFCMLPFGQHDVMYAPEWFLARHADDPDIRKVSWDGLQGRDSSGMYGLNFYHPAVRELIRDYLPRIAAFCRNEPRVLFYETAQEAYPYFGADGVRRQTGYGPSALAEFHRWLEAEYDDIAALNAAWGTDYAGFEAIEPPPDRFAVPDREITPLVAEFERFIENGYIDYLKLIYDSIKAGDPTKPVASRHSSLLTAINGAGIFETCDILGFHTRAPNMQVMNLYLNSLSRYNGHRSLAYLEDFWGTQQEADRITDERVQRRGLEKHVCRTFTWGRTLQMKWYAYTTGSYLFTYNGNWFDPRYDVLTMRYCAPALKVALDRMRNLDWVLTHSQIPQLRVCIWQPSASMRTQARTGLSAGEIIALHQVIFPGGFPYELVPEEYFADGRARLDDFDVVFLPCAEFLSEEHQRRLIDYVRGGGTLIAGEPPGVRDELTRPSGLMLRELWGIHEASFDAEAARWSYQQPAQRLGETELRGASVGEGEAYLSQVTLSRALGGEAGNETLLALLGARVMRDAWAEKAQFEVVLRVTQEGERYLFVLNPSPDEARSDTIHTRFAARTATDVSVQGGFPVPLRAEGGGAALDLTLGPCETAVLWLR
ncbi:MAG: beta-galactosidase [Armatimonadota bacterium]